MDSGLRRNDEGVEAAFRGNEEKKKALGSRFRGNDEQECFREKRRKWTNHESKRPTKDERKNLRHHDFNLYPVLKIHHTAPRQIARNTSVIVRLTTTFTSAIP